MRPILMEKTLGLQWLDFDDEKMEQIPNRVEKSGLKG